MHFFRFFTPIIVFLIFQILSPSAGAQPMFQDSLLNLARIRMDSLSNVRKSYELAVTAKTFVDKAEGDRFEPRRTKLLKSVLKWKQGEREKVKLLAEETYSKFTELEELTELLLYLDPGRFPLIHDLTASRIPLSGTDLIGPLSPNAPFYYTFERGKTEIVNGSHLTTFHMVPREDRAECFEGILIIRNSDGAVMELDAGISSRVHYYPFSRRLHVRQIFDPKSGMARRAEWEFEAQLPFYGTLRHVSILEVTRQTINGAGSGADTTQGVVSNDADSGNLASQLEDGLSEYERSTLQLLTPFRSRSEKPKFWGFSALPDPRYNRVEGGYAGGIVGFKNISLGGVIRDLSIEGSYGYGFEDKKYKHRVEMSQGFWKNNVRIGGKYFKELKEKEQDQLGGVLVNSLTALAYRYDKFHYFYVLGWETYSRVNLTRNLILDLRYTDRRDYSAVVNTRFALVKGIIDYDPNYPIRAGRLHRLAAVVEYQLGHGKGIKPRNAYVKTEFHVAHSNNNWLKSDFDFTRLFSSSRFHIPTTRRGSLDGMTYLGYTRGTLPQQYLFDLYGVVPYAMRTVSLLETSETHIQGSRIAAIVLEHNFGGELLEKTGLPLLGNGKTDLIPLLGIGFADVTGKTKSGLVSPTRTLKKPVVEAGFGLGDVFRYLRLEFVWRLNQRRLGTSGFTATILTLLNDY